MNRVIKSSVEVEVTENLKFSIRYILIKPRKEPEKKIKKITFIANTHGNEINGVEVLKQLELYLKHQEVQGEILLIPIANPLAFQARERKTPNDGKDLNRCFPGNKDGSVTDKIAYEIFNLIKDSNYVIDLHTGPEGRILLPHPRMFENDESKTLAEMCRIYGTLIAMTREIIPGSLAGELKKIKVPAMTVEIGESNSLNNFFIRYGLFGAINLLKYYRFIEGRATIPARQYILTKRINILSEYKGFLYPSVKLGDVVSKGTILGEVYDVETNTSKDIISEERGIVLSIQTYAVIRPGDIIFSILPVSRSKLNNVDLVKKRYTIFYSKNTRNQLLTGWYNG